MGVREGGEERSFSLEALLHIVFLVMGQVQNLTTAAPKLPLILCSLWDNPAAKLKAFEVQQ